MVCAHMLVKGRRAGISLYGYPGRAETSGLGYRPLEQSTANAGPDQSRFDKKFQKVCIRTPDFDLRQSDNNAIAFGDLDVRGAELVGVQR
jgi:hypothetical protein